VHLHAIVLSQSILRHQTLLSFALSDATIEFRFRDSMELASADGNNEEVSTLPQSGFAFPQHEPSRSMSCPSPEMLMTEGLHTALSPNYCCAVVIDSEGDVKLRRMEYTIGNLRELKDDQREASPLRPKSSLTNESSAIRSNLRPVRNLHRSIESHIRHYR